MTAKADERFPPLRALGISVMPGYLQSEGVDAVLGRFVGMAKATDVTFYPKLLEPAPDGQGVRHPPHDGDAGHVRLFDRPVWGRREFWARSHSSYVPDMALFAGQRYRPNPATALTEREGGLVRDFVERAAAAGLNVHLQMPATIPETDGHEAGPQPDDLPRLPDGRIPEMQVDRFGSLASEDILAFGAARVVDLARAYPQVATIRLDWPEMPPYTVDNVFCDFSDHARRVAPELGFDFERMRADAGVVYSALHGHLPDVLKTWDAGGATAILERWPGLGELFAFKRALAVRLVQRYRGALDDAGLGHVGLIPQGFPAPWNHLSGFDYTALAPLSAALAVKLYTMHWPMMVRYHARPMVENNPGIAEADVVERLVRAFDLTEPDAPFDARAFAYPDPDTPHPVSSGAMTRKARAARAATPPETPLLALTHSYGPLSDFQRRLGATLAGGVDRVWIQRYSYLSDEKLAWLGSLPRA